MQKVIFKDLGKIDYQEAWNLQQNLLDELVQTKRSNSKINKDNPAFQRQKHYLLFCEHKPVYTLGKSGSLDHLLLSETQLDEKGIDFYKINRGGDITFHGQGQIVGYPIFDMDEFFTDIHKYVRYLEEAIIRTIAEYGLQGIRKEGFTGVWLDQNDKQPYRKICAIGVHLSRWVTMHGFAFNVNTDLNYFNYIVPCGINDKDKAVTSLQQELGHELDIEEVKEKVKKHFAELFGFVFVSNDITNTLHIK
jgi:lipoyl(octanoyl) transferase